MTEGFEEFLSKDILGLEDLVQILKSCANKKLKADEIDVILRYFYRDGENEFKNRYPKIYQNLEPEMISLLGMDLLEQASTIHLFDPKSNSFISSSIKKAIEKITKILKIRIEDLNNRKRIQNYLKEQLEQVKITEKKRKLEQKESFLRDHPHGLDKNAIEHQSKILFTNIEDLSAKTLKSIAARYNGLQSAIDRILDEDIKEPMQERIQIYRSFFESIIKSAKDFIDQMKAMFIQLGSQNFEVIRAFWNSSMELAILSGINATTLDESKSEEFLTSMNHLRDETFNESPDLQCAFYWWLKGLKAFYQSYHNTTKKVSDTLKNA